VGATLRLFVPADRSSLKKAIDAVCAEGRWMATAHFEPTPAWTHALERPGCPHHRLLVAEEGGQIVGWCRLFPLAGCGQADGQAEVGIGLLREYRGQGLGRMFLHQALDWAARQELEQVRLCTRGNNARAIHLFEGCGFATQGYGLDGWLEMACHLPAGGYANGR
jgi:RimJ/RimL family protein N-acetyltransferase